MRGKPANTSLIISSGRITPAGAGKTVLGYLTTFPSTDHPRRCGENSSPCSKRLQASGSPPQVRGKRQKEIARAVHGRITPAGAGKTHDYAEARYWRRDHPRRCGENKPIWDIAFLTIGSPPQVRGKRSLAQDCHAVKGITPAGAGKTNCPKQIACGI